jgi:hypothetical protein
MRIEDIKRYQNAVPFKPYVLHVSDGRRFRVAHRDNLALSPVKSTILVFDTDGYWDAIDLLHVFSIDDRPTRGNGKSKKSA